MWSSEFLFFSKVKSKYTKYTKNVCIKKGRGGGGAFQFKIYFT